MSTVPAVPASPVSKIVPSPQSPKPTTSVPKLTPPVHHPAVQSDAPPPFPRIVPSVPEPVQLEAGEAGDFSHVTNTAFVAAIFQQLPDGAVAAVCTKNGDPTEGGWTPAPSLAVDQFKSKANNYVSCSSFTPSDDGIFSVKKSQFAAYHAIMFDDLGTKISMERLGDFKPSWLIETSPENFQCGIILAEPVSDFETAERLLKSLLAAGFSDAGASGPTRWARLPNAINGKEKYRDVDGKPFQCRLVQWRPDRKYTLQQIVDELKLEIPAKKEEVVPIIPRTADDVFTPKATENPVVVALKARGLYKTPLGSGKHDITCPFVHEHTDALDSGTAYFEPDDVYPVGGFKCMHGHCAERHVRDLLTHLGITGTAARHRSAIKVVLGELHRVVDSAEEALASLGRHYQSGGMIVSVTTDPVTGDPKILPTGLSSLTRQLSVAAEWEKFDARLGGWLRCDPPPRHTGILHDSKTFQHLPPLSGVARQPYFREADGKLVMESGYDKISQIFAVFDPRQFVIPEPTIGSARTALALLEELLAEFHFVSPHDKAAALSAMFTATVRPSLPHAPAYHAKAPVFGSGKSYLCEVIGSFAGPGLNSKVSYPKSSEEATKVILSLLMTNPAVIEFDDMDTDWTPHGVILRALTAEQITDRILGYSKTATVSTKSLMLGSGNNVGPVRDLLRRVLTINIDPRCATPATMTYRANPLQMVRKGRGKYVAAVLTIISAWKACGSPKTACESIATFGGAWSEYCRQPLMWLGHPDPATALFEQVKHDPDGDALGKLMYEWKRAFGSTPTTVRKAVEVAFSDDDLMDALKEFPVEERGVINRSKLGWMLKKNANRIVSGMEFQKSEADGRTAWRVVEVNPKGTVPIPASPASSDPEPDISNIADL